MWTLPSHASLFTGHWPHELGVNWTTPLRPDDTTLAEYLGTRGYDTAGFVANLEYCGRETGLNRGFGPLRGLSDRAVRDVHARCRTGPSDGAPELGLHRGTILEKVTGRADGTEPSLERARETRAEVDRAFLDWLTWQQGRRRPFFAFLNYNDAHTPYEPPEPSSPGFGLRPATCHDRMRMRHFTALDKAKLEYDDVRMAADVYDDCIAYLDRRLGVLLDELGRRGVLDDTLVIVTADHGEHIGDHLLFFHGCSLYRQVVQVPLVIVDPKGRTAGRVVAEPVSLRDLPATIADILGPSKEAPFPGRSLARLGSGDPSGAGPSAEPLLMETDKPLVFMNEGREPAAKGPMKAMVAGGMHYIRSGRRFRGAVLPEVRPGGAAQRGRRPAAVEILRRFRGRPRGHAPEAVGPPAPPVAAAAPKTLPQTTSSTVNSNSCKKILYIYHFRI